MDTGQAILLWYLKNKRNLPWRAASDPYAVLVSEMMLQQTTVDTVLRYYNAFMARFPTAAALAAADEADVLGAWQGLGYYSRARNLHKAARIVTDKHGGVFPSTYDDVRALPGIGPYIAGAVMSIAFDQPYPAVDGNVLRVMARLFGLQGDVTRPAVRRDVEARVADIMPKNHAGDFTQAMMELGALVCRPSSPDCAACPVRTECVAHKQGMVHQLPVKTAKKPPVVVPLWAIVVITPESVLMQYRGNETLLKNMWGVPAIPRQGEMPHAERVRDVLGFNAGDGRVIGRVTHVFTHRRWEMDVVLYHAAAETNTPLKWVRRDTLGDFAVPTAFKKVLGAVGRYMKK